jgi:hypothetical protein
MRVAPGDAGLLRNPTVTRSLQAPAQTGHADWKVGMAS